MIGDGITLHLLSFHQHAMTASLSFSVTHCCDPDLSYMSTTKARFWNKTDVKNITGVRAIILEILQQ